jgi:hypothetical protein
MKIKVKVTPGSSEESIEKQGDRYKIKIKEKAEKGNANKSLIKLLAKHFKIPGSKIKIISGMASRNKLISIGY